MILNATGEDGIWLCTFALVPGNCPVGGYNGTITLESGSATTIQADSGAISLESLLGSITLQSDEATVSLETHSGTSIDDFSAAGVTLAESTSSGNIELSNSGTGNISLDSAKGISIADNSSSGIQIDESGAGNISLGGTNFFLFSSATPAPTHTYCLQIDNTGLVSNTGASCGTGSGTVNSVVNSDSTLTISPTTGSVVASLNLGHANTWTGNQTFGNVTIGGTCTGCNSGISGGAAGQLAVFGTSTTITSGITVGNSGSDIPQLSSGLLNASVLPLATTGAFGAIKPDGSSCTVSAGVLTCPGTSGISLTTTGTSGLTTLTTGVLNVPHYAGSGANSDITSLTGLTTPLSPSRGGTGSSGLTGYMYGNGTSIVTASTTIPGSAIVG